MKKFNLALLLAATLAGNGVSAQTDTNRGDNDVVWKPQTVLSYVKNSESDSWGKPETITYTYDQYGYVTSVDNGRKTTYTYDPAVPGYLIDTRLPSLWGGEGEEWDDNNYYHEEVARDANNRVVSAKYVFDQSGTMYGTLDVEYDETTGKAKKMTVKLGDAYTRVFDDIEWAAFDGTRLKIDPYIITDPGYVEQLLTGPNRIKSANNFNVEYMADGGYKTKYGGYTFIKTITDANGSYVKEKNLYRSDKIYEGKKTIVTLDNHGNVVKKESLSCEENGIYEGDTPLTCEYTYNSDYGYPETRIGDDMDEGVRVDGIIKLEYRDYLRFAITGINNVSTDNSVCSDGVYNLNGVKMSSEKSLPNGIYMKRMNGRTVKILK